MPERTEGPVASSAVRSGPPSRRRVIGVAVALALVVALVVWLLVRDGDDEDGVAATPVGQPVEMSESELLEFGRAQAVPVYWAGARNGTRYEVTRTARGQVYIRYLTGDARPGDPRPRFLTIGTYPQQDAYAVVSAAGRRRGYTDRTTQSGALVVYSPRRDTNVYFTFPNAGFQVEVYDPDPRRALSMVLGGQVVQLR
jgi:hypothetical protein